MRAGDATFPGATKGMAMTRSRHARNALALLTTAVLVLVGLAPSATAAATGTITGRVSAPTGSVYEGYVELWRWDRVNGSWWQSSSIYVPENGSESYTFTGIEAGTQYTLLFDPSGSEDDGYVPEQALGKTFFDTRVKESAQVITGTAGSQTINFALSPGVEVKGKVVVPSGVAGPVRVGLFAPYSYRDWSEGVLLHDGAGLLRSVALAPDGSYSFPRVLPGARYSVAVMGRQYSSSYPLSHEPVSLTGTGSYASTRALRHITAATTLPTVTMKRTVPVTGKFVAPAGVTITGTEVTLVEVDPTGYYHELSTTTVGADGSYTFPEGAFPGRSYTVELDSGSGFERTYPGLSSSITAAQAFTAGAAGLTIPDAPVLVDARWVSASDVYLRGTPAIGHSLEMRSFDGELGAISSSPGASITYRWYRGYEIIPGATKPRYTPTIADLNQVLKGMVIVRAPGYRADYVSTSSVVVTQGSAPYATTYPVISGKAKVGAKLSVSKGSWSVPNVKLSYQWVRDGAAIAGATSTSYVLRAADRGKRVSVRISASAPGQVIGKSETAASARVALGDAAKAKKKPKIKGTKRVGKKLTVTRGTWSLPGVKVSYQWLRDGKKISKATKKSYKLKKKDQGKRISVRVTVKKTGYKSTKLVTKKTAKIKAKKR